MHGKVWIKVTILEEYDDTRVVRGTFFDGTEFDIKVSKWLVTPTGMRGHRGWLEVQCEGEQHGRCQVVLPAPTEHHGRTVSVSRECIDTTIGEMQLATMRAQKQQAQPQIDADKKEKEKAVLKSQIKELQCRLNKLEESVSCCDK